MSDPDSTKGLRIEGGAPLTRAATRSNQKAEARITSNDVSNISRRNEDTVEIQRVPSPSNNSSKNVARKKKDTVKKTSTSTTKRRETSSQKSKACTSSDGVGKTKATVDENKVKEKPKPKDKSNKKDVNKNSKHKQGEATPTIQPGQFIGLFVCKELDGDKTVGTVRSYDPKTKLFEIGYEDDKTGHMEMNEVLKSKANMDDIAQAKSQHRCMKFTRQVYTDKQDEVDTSSGDEDASSGEEYVPTRKRKSTCK